MAKNTSKYTMRKLKTGDIFKMSKILKAMNLKFELPEGADTKSAGIAILTQIVENLHLAEKEVADFLGDLVGLTADEFEELEIEETFEIIELFKEANGFSRFLSMLNK